MLGWAIRTWIFSLTTLVFLACTSSDSGGGGTTQSGRCEVGSETICACSDGSQSTQVCSQSGTFLPCQCNGVVSDPRATCDLCEASQVCVAGNCVDVPNECPCPLETYCDLALNTCVIGCTVDENCDGGRICFTDVRECRYGCRDDGDCPSGRICENEICVEGCRDDAGCPSGNYCEQMTCIAGCRSDANCGAGSICVNMGCAIGCRDDSGCAAGQICRVLGCTPGCRSVTECPQGADCVDGACVCPGGWPVCNGLCFDMANDANNCGQCGRVCTGAGAQCIGGNCACGGTTMLCGDACIDVSSDIHNCGGCGIYCGPGTLTQCIGGSCVNGGLPESGPYSPCGDQFGPNCPDCVNGICAPICNESTVCPTPPGGWGATSCGFEANCEINCYEGPAWPAIPGVPPCPEGMRCDLGTTCVLL